MASRSAVPDSTSEWELPVHYSQHLDATLDRLVAWLDQEVKLRLLKIDNTLSRIVEGSVDMGDVLGPGALMESGRHLSPEARACRTAALRTPRGPPQGDLGCSDEPNVLAHWIAEDKGGASQRAAIRALEASPREQRWDEDPEVTDLLDFPNSPKSAPTGKSLNGRGPVQHHLAGKVPNMGPKESLSNSIPAVSPDDPLSARGACGQKVVTEDSVTYNETVKNNIPVLNLAREPAHGKPDMQLSEGKATVVIPEDPADDESEDLSPATKKLKEAFTPGPRRSSLRMSFQMPSRLSTRMSSRNSAAVGSTDKALRPNGSMLEVPATTEPHRISNHSAIPEDERSRLAREVAKLDIYCHELMGSLAEQHSVSERSGSKCTTRSEGSSQISPRGRYASGRSGALARSGSNILSSSRSSGGVTLPRNSFAGGLEILLAPARSEFAQTIWEILDDAESSTMAKVYEQVMFAFVSFSVITAMLQSVKFYPLQGQHSGVILESCIDAIFLAEIVLRFMVCPNRALFFTNSYNFIDILSGLPLILRAIMDFAPLPDGEDMLCEGACSILVGFVPVLRLSKMLRTFLKFKLLLKAFRVALEALPVMIFIYGLLLLGFSAVLYAVESRDNIDTYYRSIWLTIVSMTTLGYGDIYPEEDAGRFVIGLCVFCTMFYTAIPLGIIGNAFNDVWKDRDRILLMQRARDGMKQAGYTAKDVKKLFRIFDRDNDSLLNMKEFAWMLEGMRLGLKRERMVELYELFDDDQSGGIDEREFVKNLFPESYHDLYGDTEDELQDEIKRGPLKSHVSVDNDGAEDEDGDCHASQDEGTPSAPAVPARRAIRSDNHVSNWGR